MASLANTVVYVDQRLAVAVAAKLVGVLRTSSHGAQAKAGFNWLVATEVGANSSSSIASDIRELLPEDLIYHFNEHIPHKANSVRDALPWLSTGVEGGLPPGSVVSVQGILTFPGLTGGIQSSPFQNAVIDLPQIIFHGETAICARIESDGFSVPVYFSESAKYQVVFCERQPVEVSAVVRWVPPYSPGGARSLNLALKCFALWLR